MTGADRAGYDPALFDALAAVEDRHFWFTSRNSLLERVLARLDIAASGRVLEVGVGTGNTLRVLEHVWPHAMVIGVDAYEEGFRAARRRTRAHLVRASGLALPFTGGFDVVAAFDVLEHVADDRAALIEIRRVLQPGGRLVVTVPALGRLWSRVDEDAHHVRRYERDGLHASLTAAGFAVDRIAFFMAALYPLLRGARRLARGGGAHADGSAVARELRVVPILNAGMRAILGTEMRLVAAGWQLPIGTSLLAVARPADRVR